ncbi:MAG: hypothetical protein J6T70_01560 [Bacteroidales bacterium]|nr:hypothetical protein [Bacteroidales bacterium]
MKIKNIISHFTKAALTAALVFIGLSAFSQTTETLGGYDFAIETDDEGQYYKVDCANALKGLASYVNSNNTALGKRFKQTQDITLTGTFEPLNGVFSGIYDGNNMTISGLYTERAGRIALFGYLKDAIVKNLILLNPSNNALNDQDKIASLVGYALTSTIDNCKVINPTLTWKKSAGCRVGAIVAECTQNSTIKDCYVYSTEYSAYDYYSNTCTIENVGSIFKISVDGCSFTSTATVITVAGTDYYPEGSEIALSHTNRDGYAFANYTANGTTIDGNTYTIDNTDVEFDAIWKKLLTHTDITISGISSQTYNGSAFTPVVTIKDGETTLTENSDYTITLPEGGCVNAGDYTVTITGKGNYTGTVEKTFTINPRVTTSGALTLTEYGNRTTAEIQGDFSNISSEDKSLQISNPKTVNIVIFKRSFSKGIPATIMLPFNFTLDASIGSFYTIESVAKDDNGEWIATPKVVTGTLQANTPYMFKAAKDLTELSFTDENGITLQSTSTIEINTNGDWTLHGVYEKTMLDGDGEFNYGFAGEKTADGISVGDFIRAGEGVWADPMRCYLTYKKGELTKAATVLPDRIRVVFPDEENSNNETTDIIENTETEDVVTPVSEISPESDVKVWSFNGTVYIEAQPDMDYTIVDLSGRTIKKGITHSIHEELNLNAKGIVIVKIGNKTYKLR